MRIFYPNIYIKVGAGITIPETQELLTTALASWTNLPFCETGAKIEEQDGPAVVLATGSKVVYGKKVVGEIKNLEVTAAIYSNLRSTFHGITSSFIFNEPFATIGAIVPTGRAAQFSNVSTIIKLEGEAGDLMRISITFEKEGDLTTVVTDHDLT